MIWAYIIGVLAVIIGFGAFFGAPYVPSRRRDLKRMFDTLYPLADTDVLIDAGSGDGLVLREASRRGAKAVGYEINPLLAALSKWVSRNDKKVTVVIANFWLSKFPKDTTVIYIFSVERDGSKLEKKIQSEATRLNKTLILICYGSPLPKKSAERTFEAYHLYLFEPVNE